MIIGITTTLNEADGYQRVNVEYINRVAAAGATPLLLTPIPGGAEANRRLAQSIIDTLDGLIISGGGDIHPRYYVPAPNANRDALGMDELRHLGCGSSSSSRCASTGAEVPFCGHYVANAAFEKAMGGVPLPDLGTPPEPPAAERAAAAAAPLPDLGPAAAAGAVALTELDGRHVQAATDAVPVPCLDGLLAVSEDRDGFELELARLAHERGLPCLGICRGMQVMNVALGGSLYRDLYNCGVTGIGHRQEPPYDRPTDTVTIATNSLLSSVLSAAGTFMVNSMHHQGIDHVAEPLLVSARSTVDKVVEGVEDPELPFFLGVQWHPEYLPRHRGIFAGLAEAAEDYRTRRNGEVARP